MATDVTLPQLGESVTEGTITAWLVEVGDHVEADQPLFELSSDKIDTEVPAPTSGVLTEIKVQVDETVDVGTVVAVIGGDGEPAAQDEGGEAEAEAEGGDAEAAAPADEREDVAEEDTGGEQPQPAGAAPDVSDEQDRAEPESAAEEPQSATGTHERTEATEQPPAPSGDGDGRGQGVLASPIVRRMVSEAGLDITAITPSGKGGRVTREDVEAAIAQHGGDEAAQEPAAREAPAAEAPAAREDAKPRTAPQPERRVSTEAGERERVEDLSRIRQRIAAKMTESLQSAAQLTTVQEADMTRVMRLRDRLKDDFKAREGVSLSPFVFLCRAAVLVLRRSEFGMVSAQADWEAGKVRFHDYVNLGIAVDTERGLLVPNIKSADDLTLPALARAITEVADKARGRGRLEISDIEGGTFTMTNTGSRGVLIDTPILNYPEVAILGTGAIKRRPIVIAGDDGIESISVRDMIYLSMTYDHRLLDGADAARFITAVAEVIEEHDWEQEVGY